jgi:hypothetical protein
MALVGVESTDSVKCAALLRRSALRATPLMVSGACRESVVVPMSFAPPLIAWNRAARLTEDVGTHYGGWDNAYQTALELPEDTLQDCLVSGADASAHTHTRSVTVAPAPQDKYARIARIQTDFASAAEAFGRIIVAEHGLADELRTFVPLPVRVARACPRHC